MIFLNMSSLEYYEYQKQAHRRKLLIAACALLFLKNKNRNKDRRWHVRPIFKERRSLDHYTTLVKEYQLNNSAMFFNFMRMSPSNFEDLVSLVAPLIYRHPYRPDILSPREILSATLRYLATGDSMASIMYSFRIGESTVSGIIKECCLALWEVLKVKVFFTPNKHAWLAVSEGFSNCWDMPNCVGAMDGKHIVHQAFPNSGSMYYNYKGTHSIVLLAICDAEYNFTAVDIGAPGRCSDGGVFRQCNLGKQILNNEIDFPDDAPIDSENGLIPYYIVADEAFMLLPNVMRPFPGRSNANLPIDQAVFNYRLSRARRCIENTFGIMASKWRIFRRPIIATEETVNAIVQATVVLHNYVKKYESREGVQIYCDHTRNQSHSMDEIGALAPIRDMGSNNYGQTAKVIREKIKNYFMNEGELSYQYDKI